jgi:hypothetical protein
LLLDEPRYRRLLGKALPVVVRTDAEYRRLLGIVERMMERPEEAIGEEEGRLLELLGVLVEEYEDRAHPVQATRPPSAITRPAIVELEAGKGKKFASVDALMADLNADDYA